MEKRLLFYFLAFIFCRTIAYAEKPTCELLIKPEWRQLDHQEKKFNSKWILAATFIIKQREKDSIRLEEIHLSWHGNYLDTLTASLFRKEQNKDLLPIEEKLVCDGVWNSKDQKIKLRFKQKEHLNPTTIYCLVLTIPNHLEHRLKNGYFDVLPESLPEQLKPAAENKHLRISMPSDKGKFARKHRLRNIS